MNMQERVISDPHGYGLMVVSVHDKYAPSDFEYATKGDDLTPTFAQACDTAGKGLQTIAVPLSFLLIGSAIAITQFSF